MTTNILAAVALFTATAIHAADKGEWGLVFANWTNKPIAVSRTVGNGFYIENLPVLHDRPSPYDGTGQACTIVQQLATNWTTVSRTVPVITDNGLFLNAVMHYDQLNQVGVVVTNYVAVIAWKGKTNSFVLETVDARREKLSRTIYADPWGRY